jgi:hypothetical protein
MNIPLYIQQDAMLHNLLYLETALHDSGGITTHYQERMQRYLQHLVFVTPLLLPATIVEELELRSIPSTIALLSTLCMATPTNYTYKQPSTYEKPESASAVVGS